MPLPDKMIKLCLYPFIGTAFVEITLIQLKVENWIWSWKFRNLERWTWNQFIYLTILPRTKL